MRECLRINLPFGRKAIIPLDAYQAAKRAIPIYSDDSRVAAYAAAPHEGVTAEVVAAIRRGMIVRGELPERAYSRRGSR